MAFLKKILVPVDFSEPARHALDFGARLAEQCQCELTIVHVSDDSFLNSPTTSEDYRKENEAKLSLSLNEMIADQFGPDVNIPFKILRGDVAINIVNFANENAIDLIILGATGRSAVAEMLLGSVAHKVIKTAGCPVVSVR